MTLAIDASTPALVSSNTSATSQSATTASFTAPLNSLLVVMLTGDAFNATTNSTLSVTDNRGTHLTYTQRVLAQSTDTPNAGGAATIWTAPVTSSVAMTVTGTDNSNSVGVADMSMQVVVLTDSGSTPTVGANGKLASATAGTTIAGSLTATLTGSWSFGCAHDWNATGNMTAGGVGNTLISTVSFTGNSSHGHFRRTTADGVNTSATTITATLGGSSSAKHIVLVEILGTSAVVASFVPTLLVRRRTVRRIPLMRINMATTAPPDQPVPKANPQKRRVRRVPPPRLNSGTTGPTDYQLIPVPPRRTPKPRRFVPSRSDGDSFEPPFTVTTPPVNPSITQSLTGRIRRAASQLRRPSSAPEPIPAQVVVTGSPAITQTTSARARRVLTLYRRRAAPGSPLPGQDAIPGATTHPLRSVRSQRRTAKIGTPLPPQFNPPIVATVFGRLRVVARIQPRPKVEMPVQAQQAVTPNPQITATIFGRLRMVGRYQPRPRVSDPTPAQQAVAPNPKITATVFGRLSRVGRYQPRARVSDPTPTQPGATIAAGRLRTTGRIARRASLVSPVPTQTTVVNPQITATVFGRLRTVARIQPRSRVSDPTPAQQAVVPNPKITQTMFGRLRSVGRTNRIPRVAKPIPVQVNPPYPVKPSRVIATRGVSRRRGSPVSVPQVQPTAETRTIPTMGLRGLRRVWLKIRRKNVLPVPGQVTTLEGPLIITDSAGGVSAQRGGVATLGGAHSSQSGVTDTYDSDSESL